MAGASGAVLRTLPSPKCRPSISTDGKKIGIALEASTCRTSIRVRSTLQRPRFHSGTSGRASRNTTPSEV
jgi:hypothetical protein